MAFFMMDLIFPPRCVHCRAYLGHGQALCGACRRRIVLHRAFFCGQCRARIYFPAHSCHRDFPFLLGAAGEYADPVLKTLIHALKFQFVRDAAKPLGRMLGDYAARLGIPRAYDLVVPIPLGRRRRRERGFNQSELIARVFAERCGLPMESGALQRTRHTPPQSGLRKTEARLSNVAGCFEAGDPGKVAGRNIILLDDVVTSGATMHAASAALKAAGAKNILALAAAKA